MKSFLSLLGWLDLPLLWLGCWFCMQPGYYDKSNSYSRVYIAGHLVSEIPIRDGKVAHYFPNGGIAVTNAWGEWWFSPPLNPVKWCWETNALW